VSHLAREKDLVRGKDLVREKDLVRAKDRDLDCWMLASS